jgi:hypothetical protein
MIIGLKAMMSNESVDWVFVLNNDIAFYPGVLKRISHYVERSLIHDKKFGIGFTSLCCGGQFSAVIYTRRYEKMIMNEVKFAELF